MTGKSRDDYSGRCTGTKKDGSECNAWALRDGSRLCVTHSRTPEELAAHARKMGKASLLSRRTKSEIAADRPMSSFRDGVTLQQVIDTCRPALTATFEHDGAPDWGARLLACLVLLHAFPRALRSTPENVRELLLAVLPSTHAEELAGREARDFYLAGRAEWIEARVRHHELTGLYVEAFPKSLIAPWESAKSVARELPNLADWTVQDIESTTHVLAIPPTGNAQLVPRDVPRLVTTG